MSTANKYKHEIEELYNYGHTHYAIAYKHYNNQALIYCNNLTFRKCFSQEDTFQ